MASWTICGNKNNSQNQTGRKERKDPELLDRGISENHNPTHRRHYDPLFNIHPPFEVDIEDYQSFELDPKELAIRIIRAVAAGEWARQIEVDEEGTLASFAALGVRMGSLRRGRGLSLDELASRSGADADVLFAIELGLASASQVAQHLEPIMQALGDQHGDLQATLMQICPVR